MNLVLAIVAAVAALAAAGLWYWRTRVGTELALMRATETNSARDIAGKAPGALVELKGRFRTDAPLTAELSSQACVWYRALVEREIERVTTGSDGKRETRRNYETVTSVEKHAPCRLEDATGSVAVDFEGARVEALQSHQRTEAAGTGTLIGALLGSDARTLGHRYTEWTIPADVPVYVLGSATAAGSVGVDPGGKNPFIISHKTEEEREKTLGRTRFWLLAGAAVCAAVAVAFLVWSMAAST
jgi:hypothetical protein